MKKLFASASYSFNNFYNNLNVRGQLVFTVIVILLVILFFILCFSYIVQSFKNRKRVKKVLKENKNTANNLSKTEEPKDQVVLTEKVEEVKDNKTEVSNIANEIEKALMEEKNISLTEFEEDQERTAIISIDELMRKAKELEIMEDEETGVNYMEKYNLEPAEVKEVVDVINNGNEVKEEDSKPIKSFKVSQVISPVYGIKKEVINNDRF